MLAAQGRGRVFFGRSSPFGGVFHMPSILDNPAIRQAALVVTVEQYHRLGETGVIAEKTELLKGVIVEKMVKSPLHSWLVQSLVEWLRKDLPPGLHVRQEQPLTFADSEPEPDVAVVVGSSADYRSSHPSTAVLVDRGRRFVCGSRSRESQPIRCGGRLRVPHCLAGRTPRGGLHASPGGRRFRTAVVRVRRVAETDELAATDTGNPLAVP